MRRRSNARAAHSPDRRDLRPSSGRDPVRPELITQGRRWRCLVHDLGGARGGRRATRGFVCKDVEIWHRGAVGFTGQGPATWACRPAWAVGPGQGDRGCGSAGRAPTSAMSDRRCECSRNRYSSCSPSSVSVGAAPARPRHRRDIAGGCPSSPERLLGCPAAATTLRRRGVKLGSVSRRRRRPAFVVVRASRRRLHAPCLARISRPSAVRCRRETANGG